MQLGILAEAKTLTERNPPVHVLFGVGVRMVIQTHSAMARVEALISSGVGGRWDTAVQPSRHCFIFYSVRCLYKALGSNLGIHNMPSNSNTNITAMFKCNYSGCNASYQRKEHLRRHQIKHSQQQVFPCSNCDREFARRYLEFIES